MQTFVQIFPWHGLFGLLAIGQFVFVGCFVWSLFKEERGQDSLTGRRQQKPANHTSGKGIISEPSDQTRAAAECE